MVLSNYYVKIYENDFSLKKSIFVKNFIPSIFKPLPVLFYVFLKDQFD